MVISSCENLQHCLHCSFCAYRFLGVTINITITITINITITIATTTTATTITITITIIITSTITITLTITITTTLYLFSVLRQVDLEARAADIAGQHRLRPRQVNLPQYMCICVLYM